MQVRVLEYYVNKGVMLLHTIQENLQHVKFLFIG